MRAPDSPRRNFRVVEWQEFRATLKKALDENGGLIDVNNVEDLKDLYRVVMSAVNTAVNAHVPFSKATPPSVFDIVRTSQLRPVGRRVMTVRLLW